MIFEKDQIITYQSKYVSELNSKLEVHCFYQSLTFRFFQYKSAFELKEKKLLQDNLEKQKAIFKELDDKYKLLCKTHGIEERKIEEKAHGNVLKKANEVDEAENPDEPSFMIVLEPTNKKKEIVKQVLFEDVMNYGD